MGRLSGRGVGGRLGRQPARLATPVTEAERTKQRAEIMPGRALYNTARWKRLRLEIIQRDGFICRQTGVRLTGRAPAANSPVVDHIRPHRGDPDLFWDPDNLQLVSKAWHDSEKQRQEKRDTYAPGQAPLARPDWFRPVHVPLTIVVGPPGAGKTTWVRRHAGPDDLVICFEQVTQRLFDVPRLNAEAGDPRIGDVLRARNAMIGDLMHVSARRRWPAAWLILTEPKALHRQWWAARLRPREITVLATPADVCLARCRADAAAGDLRRADIDQVIARWWTDYRPRPDEVVIAPPGA